MNRYVTEFIGTFFLVLTIGMTVVGNVALAPLAIGGVLMAMIYMGGPISGAHYNPAITVAIWMRGKLDAKEIGPYIVAQVAGAFVASLAVKAILGATFAPTPGAGVETVPALLTEILFTFALALVILNVATNPAVEGNSYYGFAIGLVIVVGGFVGGSISGAVYNPAVGLGPTLLHGGNAWSHLWLYFVGPFAGGAAAAVVYRIQHP